MPNDPNVPNHAAAQVVASGDPVVTVPDGVAGYTKAVMGAVTGVGTALAAAFLDGHVDGGEAGVIVSALIAGFGLVWAVRNKQKVA